MLRLVEKKKKKGASREGDIVEDTGVLESWVSKEMRRNGINFPTGRVICAEIFFFCDLFLSCKNKNCQWEKAKSFASKCRF